MKIVFDLHHTQTL